MWTAVAASVLFLFLTAGSYGQEKAAAPDDAQFSPTPEWVDKNWEGYTFEVPANWTALDKSAWGILDRQNRAGVAFRVSRENIHVKDMPRDEGGELEELGSTWLAGREATGYFVKGALEADVMLQAKSICLDEPEPDGKFLVFTGMVVGLDWNRHSAVMERIFSSIEAKPSQ